MRRGLAREFVQELRAVYCSEEQKAIDSAAISSEHLGLTVVSVRELGENDRSATGFLEPAEFERTADTFFAQPETSVRGWERACDAQRRIVAAVSGIMQRDAGTGPIAIVSHGAVGTLFHCWLMGRPIERRWDQPNNGGGNCFGFTWDPPEAHGHWCALDAA